MNTLPPVALLAGGLAQRLRPMTETIPKALVIVQGKPFIVRQVEQLRSQGITHVVCCVGYKGEMIEETLGSGDRFGMRMEYSYDGRELLGTGGAIKHAIPLLGPEFFVLYGDSYLQVDYRQVKEVFDRSHKAALLTIFENKGQWDQSNLHWDGARIVAYSKRHRTPAMTYIDYGLSIMKSAAFDHYPSDAVFDLADVYERLVSEDQLAGLAVTERFYEIGSHQGLHEFDAFLQERRRS